MTERPTLIVMAKAPRLGHGKQRLAATLGATTALRINRAMQATVLRRVVDPRWRMLLAVSPDSALTNRAPGLWPDPARVPRAAQGAGDLGARLATVLRQAACGPVCVIGTDAPDIQAVDIASAFRALRGRARSVLGPADDGGFWLVGAQRAAWIIAALPDVRWSTANAMADIAVHLPRPLHLLRRLADIDDETSWRARTRQRAAWRASSGT